MNIKLFLQVIIKYVFGVLIIGALLFIPVNSFEYWNAWLFMGLLFVTMFIAWIILMIKNPELLRKRLNAREKESEQKWVLLFSGLMFLSGFIIAGLNYRYEWIEIPNIVIIISSFIEVLSVDVFGEEDRKLGDYLYKFTDYPGNPDKNLSIDDIKLPF